MRKAICLTVFLVVCLCASVGVQADDHREKLIVEPADVAYVKQATWRATMLDARSKVRKDVDLALGSVYARRFWRDFPVRTDWLMQDSVGKPDQWKGGLDGKGDLASYLKPGRDAALERKLIEKVLPECGRAADKLAGRLSVLVKGGAGPDDGRWLDLYVKACIVRRAERLKPLLARTRKVILVKH